MVSGQAAGQFGETLDGRAGYGEQLDCGLAAAKGAKEPRCAGSEVVEQQVRLEPLREGLLLLNGGWGCLQIEPGVCVGQERGHGVVGKEDLEDKLLHEVSEWDALG